MADSAASTMASISGRMMRVLAGQLEHDDDGGDRCAGRTAKSAPIPTSAYAPTDPPTVGDIRWTMSPKIAPAIAPQNKLHHRGLVGHVVADVARCSASRGR